jgi:hypothetical protein
MVDKVKQVEVFDKEHSDVDLAGFFKDIEDSDWSIGTFQPDKPHISEAAKKHVRDVVAKAKQENNPYSRFNPVTEPLKKTFPGFIQIIGLYAPKANVKGRARRRI